MRIDLSGPLYAALEKASEEHFQAKKEGDTATARQKAVQCAHIMENLARAVPQQREAYLARAEQWLNAAGRSHAPQSHNIVEKEDRDGEEFISQTESLITSSNVRWSDIGGLFRVKQLMMETIVIAGLKKPESIKPWKGILLFGPPGTGKTLLAAAAAGSLDATFFDVKADRMLSKYFGESSKLVAALYSAARTHAPSIVFLDEFDALCLSRGGDISEAARRTLSTILAELDGFQDKKSDRLLLTLAATNTPWDLDQAILSRFPRRIYVPLPDADACREILAIQLKGLDIETLDLALLSMRCVEKRFAGRDIANLCQQAIWSMVHDANPNLADMADLSFEDLRTKELAVRSLRMDDFNDAFAMIKSPLTDSDIHRFETWNKEFGG